MMTSGTRFEVLLRKVSLTQIRTRGKRKNVNVIGCEYSRPQVGAPYKIHLGKNQVFKTTPVVEMKETYTGLMFKTRNSIYRLIYLKGNVASQMNSCQVSSAAG